MASLCRNSSTQHRLRLYLKRSKELTEDRLRECLCRSVLAIEARAACGAFLPLNLSCTIWVTRIVALAPVAFEELLSAISAQMSVPFVYFIFLCIIMSNACIYITEKFDREYAAEATYNMTFIAAHVTPTLILLPKPKVLGRNVHKCSCVICQNTVTQ